MLKTPKIALKAPRKNGKKFTRKTINEPTFHCMTFFWWLSTNNADSAVELVHSAVCRIVTHRFQPFPCYYRSDSVPGIKPLPYYYRRDLALLCTI